MLDLCGTEHCAGVGDRGHLGDYDTGGGRSIPPS